MPKTSLEIKALISGTFNTDLGKKLLEHLTEVFINRPIYKPGLTLEETAYRQGQADVIKQLQKELKGK